METTGDLSDIWGEFEQVVQQGAPPVLADRSKPPSQRPVSVGERLTYWLVGGQGVYILSLLVVFAMADHGFPLLVALLCAFPLWTIWARPVLGPEPLERPFLMLLVTMLSALLLSLPLGLTTGWMESQRDGIMFKHLAGIPQMIQDAIEHSSAPQNVFVLMICLTVGIQLTHRSLQRRPWIPNSSRPQRRGKLILSLTLTAVVLLVPSAVVLTTSLRVQRLEWLNAASSKGDLIGSIPDYSKGIGLQNIELETYWETHPNLRSSDLREMGDIDFLRILAAVNQQIEDPQYQPSSEDANSLFERLVQRTLFLEKPFPEAARFTGNLLVLSDRYHQPFPLQWEKALRRQTFAVIAEETSLAELARWQTMADQLSHVSARTLRISELDAIAAHVTRAGRERVGPPIRLYGVFKSGRSLSSHLTRLRAQLFLLDYDRRRESIRTAPINEDFVSIRISEPWYEWVLWQVRKGYLEHPDAHQATLQALLNAREHKLTHGVYPSLTQSRLPRQLTYKTDGSSAALNLKLWGPGGAFNWKLDLR